MTDQTPSPAPSDSSPPAPKKPVALFVALGIGALLLLCASGMLVFAVLLSGSSGHWTPTSDQQRVMHELGPPQAFTLVYASDFATATKGADPPLVRMETWRYPRLGSAFSFRNGKFIARTKIAVPKQTLQSPALLPNAFVAGMSPSAVSNIIGVKSDKTAKILTKTIPGLTVEAYRGQVVAGFYERKLVTIQTFPVVVKGGGK